MKLPSLNVLGEALQPCSADPVTGFFRDGCCNTGPMDRGLHTVCALMTAEFLALSKYLGNDLSTPKPPEDIWANVKGMGAGWTLHGPLSIRPVMQRGLVFPLRITGPAG